MLSTVTILRTSANLSHLNPSHYFHFSFVRFFFLVANFVLAKMMLRVAIIFAVVTLCVAQAPRCDDPNFHSLETDTTKRLNCGPPFRNKCFCHMACYENKHQHIVNCTNSGFNDTLPLEHLPNNTKVLIFTGNNLRELPWNVFGTLAALPELKTIDMSNNNIRKIRGKAYHHVQHVTQLFLDFNELSLDPDNSHPRVFSNFVSLEELHLTDAFEDGAPGDLAVTLHNIFVNSNLTKLKKLHLEQNEIAHFNDYNVFCDLPSLLDIYLANNELDAIHFNLTCLPKLRFLDLESNKFKRVRQHDLDALQSLAKPNRTMTVDFSSNPLECGCKLNPFVHWMAKTRIEVRNKHVLKCTKGGERHKLQEEKHCPLVAASSIYRGSTVALALLSVLLLILVGSLIYVQRVQLRKKLDPVIDSVSKRVRYTSIKTSDNREMDV